MGRGREWKPARTWGAPCRQRGWRIDGIPRRLYGWRERGNSAKALEARFVAAQDLRARGAAELRLRGSLLRAHGHLKEHSQAGVQITQSRLNTDKQHLGGRPRSERAMTHLDPQQ